MFLQQGTVIITIINTRTMSAVGWNKEKTHKIYKCNILFCTEEHPLPSLFKMSAIPFKSQI